MSFVRPRQAAQETTLPPPIVFTPSGTFDGSDGPWSTFIINVGASGDGSGGQNFKVLISTSASVTYVPCFASWCDEPNEDECAKSRGVELFGGRQSLGFQHEEASEWTEDGIYSLDLARKLGYASEEKPNATLGYTTVGMGPSSSDSLGIKSQAVLCTSSRSFPMGMFGLSTAPFATGGGSSLMTFFKSLKEAYKEIPTMSYGYTAGARYRLKEVPANLVLGGYDRTRFNNATTINMPGSSNSSLVIGVKSITVETGSEGEPPNKVSMTIDNNPFMATIDSTLPYLWLPRSVCDRFEDKFGLTYDEAEELYKIEDRADSNNVDSNANITFTVGSDLQESINITNIVFPYKAFVQSASFPIYENSTRYFPIKRSTTGIYVLGRTFLQEAYIVVNYERENFLLGQAVFPDPLPPPEIVAILPSIPNNDSTAPSPVSSSSAKLSAGAIAGISISIAFVVLLVMAIGFYFLWKRRLDKAEPKKEQEPEHEPSKTTEEAKIKGGHTPELSTEYYGSPSISSTLYERHEVPDNQRVGIESIPEMESPPPIWELESPPLDATVGSDKSSPSRHEIGEYFDRRQRPGGSHHRQNSSISVMGLALVSPGSPAIPELPGEDLSEKPKKVVRRESSNSTDAKYEREEGMDSMLAQMATPDDVSHARGFDDSRSKDSDTASDVRHLRTSDDASEDSSTTEENLHSH